MLDFIYRLLLAISDAGNDDPIAQRSWRKAMAFCMIVVILIGICGLSWMRGWIPGLSGVALASDVYSFEQSTNGKIDFIELTLVRNQLTVALQNRCEAISQNNRAALSLANQILSDYGDRYHQITHQDYEPPSCDVVLIKKTNGN